MTLTPGELQRKVRQLDNDMQAIYEMYADIAAQQRRQATSLDALDARVDTLDTKIATLDGKVTTLDGKVTTLDGKVTTLDTKVDGLDTKVDGLAADLGGKLDVLTDLVRGRG